MTSASPTWMMLLYLVILLRTISVTSGKCCRGYVRKGIKLKVRKCKLFKCEVNYLRRIVLPEGYRIGLSNVKAVQELKNSVPKQVSDIGLLDYYRRYIPDFARRAKPLFELLQCHDKDLNEHKGKEQNGKSQSQVSSRKPILWNQEHQTVLEDLIH